MTALIIVVLVRGYRQSDALGRRRLKWLVYGYVFVLVPVMLTAFAVTLDPDLRWLFKITNVAVLLVPLSTFIATVRYQLFDIDRLISATTTLSVLTILLLAGLLTLAPRAATTLSTVSGMDVGTGQTLVSLVLASLVVPGHRYLRPWLDRVFFAERRALERGIERLLPSFSRCADPSELFAMAADRLDTLLRPDACAIYMAGASAFEPVIARGKALPAALSAQNPLLKRLLQENLAKPVSRLIEQVPANSRDRADLEALGADVLVPVRHRSALAAVISLGHKSSGDVYISSDLALLTAVAHTMARELQRFEAAELQQQARSMQDALRRYVPGAVASRLERGDAIEASAREVTILFVDIRGYTSFAEPRSAPEIFSVISRYTDAVSRIVRAYGGAIVEFNGDGLMVVFGAPEPLPDKERAAVCAARRIVEAVRALETGDGTTLDVGIGIATGQAYVGNIQAVDRDIWAAIGNTTNLAARLQALTRELEATIVIDTLTRQRGGPDSADFAEHLQVAIRGHSSLQDIYALRL